jgi:hypothetical protein
MLGQVLTLGTIVALSQAKAIVSNHCEHEVYIWSVPKAQGMARGLPVSSGGRYDEPWRTGTLVNPGIAIKVSSHPDGINQGKSEIDYQYTVDGDKLWISLSNIRGDAFGDNTTFYTCHGPYRSPDVPTRQCSSTDDVELVLCGAGRTREAENTTDPEVIKQCSTPAVAHNETKIPRRPRQCNSRVVGPKRTPQLKTEVATDKSKKEARIKEAKKEMKTIPLETILRKSTWAQNNSPASHIGGCPANVTDFDKPVQHVSRYSNKKETIYIASMCKKFVPYAKCHKIEHFLEARNPDYDFTDGTTDEESNTPVWADDTQMHRTIWLGAVCQKYMPEVNRSQVINYLESKHHYLTFDDENHAVRNKSTMEKPADKKSANVEARKHKKPVVCVNTLCYQQRHVAGCGKIKKAMEEIDNRFDYTTSDDEGCHTDKN